MSLRLYIIGTAFLFLMVLFLANTHKVVFHFFFLETQVSLASLIFVCTLLGMAISFIFMSISRSYKRVFKIADKLSQQKSEFSAKGKNPQ